MCFTFDLPACASVVRLSSEGGREVGIPQVKFGGSGSWVTLCDPYMSHFTASAVCKAMGYSSGYALPKEALGNYVSVHKAVVTAVAALSLTPKV